MHAGDGCSGQRGAGGGAAGEPDGISSLGGKLPAGVAGGAAAQARVHWCVTGLQYPRVPGYLASVRAVILNSLWETIY